MQVKFFSIISLLLFCLLISAQQTKPGIFFKEKEYNFGTIQETQGVILHEFTYINQGKVPLIIHEVKSTCGCTVPEWTREPVLPGKSGVITVQFDPLKQSGSINKSVQVISNADQAQVSLVMKGVVIPVQKVEDVYKFSIGNIRMQTIYASFGEINKGKTGTYTIKVFNNSTTDPAVLTFRKIPAHLKISVTPEAIEPQQEGVINMTYNSALLENWDYVVDRIEMLVNGIAYTPNNRINVTANIKEDFSSLSTEQLALAARAEFDTNEFNFGTIGDDKTVEHSFMLTNTGKTNLIIRKVSASCGCTAVQPAKTTIAPGDSTVIKAIFNARGREGNQKKAITIVTNDPRQTRRILWINAVVQKSPVQNDNQ